MASPELDPQSEARAAYSPAFDDSVAFDSPSRPLHDIDLRSAIRRDPLQHKALRRAITIPLQLVFTLLWWAAAPFAIAVLFICDVIARRPLLWMRFYIMIGVILFGQLWGLCLLFAIWIATGFGNNWRRCNAWSIAAEGYWAEWNVRAMAWIYDMHYQIEGADLLRDGPSILLMRHASINDTIMPIGILTKAHGIRLRIVLKHDLLFAPIVDAIGHRIPTAFVKRGSADPQRELDAIRAITADMHERDAIMIFPEGTRCTEEKRAKIVAKLAHDPRGAARASSLHHVLPIRLGGTMALLEAAPHANLVLCSHTGYEGCAELKDFIAGGLYRARVCVKFWRVPAAMIPRDATACGEFLDEQWRKVDDFIAAHQRG